MERVVTEEEYLKGLNDQIETNTRLLDLITKMQENTARLELRINELEGQGRVALQEAHVARVENGGGEW